MSFVSFAAALAVSLSALFAATGLLHVAAPGFLRQAYRRWQFAPGFYYVAGIAMLLTALFLAVPQTRIWGGILGGTVLFVAVVSFLNHRRYRYAVPAILLMVMLAPAMVG